MVEINPELISGLVHTASKVGKAGVEFAEKGIKETGKVVSDVAQKIDGKTGISEKAKDFDKKTGISDKYKTFDKKMTAHVKSHPALAFAEMGGLIAVDTHLVKHLFGFDKKNQTPQNSNGRSTATTLNKFSKDSNQISGTGLENQAKQEKTQSAEAQR